MGFYLCLCCYGRFFGKGEERPLLVPRTFSAQMFEVSEAQRNQEEKKRKWKKGRKIERLSREIRIIWANNPQTNAIFEKLGSGDIVNRYNRLLNEWKLLKDAEMEFKQVMGLDQDKPLVHCLNSMPPDMRIGFSHGSTEAEYDFHLGVNPLVSLDRLKSPLVDQLKTAITLFESISKKMNVVKADGESIQKDLERLIAQFKDTSETSVNIMGVRHSVELLNIQQVEQALLIVRDIITFTCARCHALMEYIVQQGDKVDVQVVKDDPENPKVIIFSKKLGR